MILPYLSGRPDEWFSALQKGYPSAARPEPWYFLRKRNLEAAQKAIDERLPRDPDNYGLLMQQALLLALKGDFRSAQERVPEVLPKIQLNSQSRHHSTYDAACVYALAGNSSEAVRWLKETASTGFPNYPLFLRDPYLDRIRTAPEFIQFMTEQNAQWERYRQEFGG
jgi:tetratricopeptide (TPR) repeat protein